MGNFPVRKSKKISSQQSSLVFQGKKQKSESEEHNFLFFARL